LAIPLGLIAGEPTAGDSPSAAVATDHPHLLSPEIRAEITASVPKYLAPLPAAPRESSSADGAGANPDDVLHLVKITVRAPRPLPFSSYEFLTPKGRLELAKKLFPGLQGPFAFLNGGIALALLEQEIELQKKRALSEMTTRTSLLDNPRDRETDQEMGNALARPNTDWRGGAGK
jgi:hypothetical protein